MNNEMPPENSKIVIYTTDDGQTKLQVKIEDETVWLTQDQMAELFDKGRTTITEHIQNAFKEGELDEKAVCREFRRTGSDGKDYVVKHYNLDVIISVGYRVKSLRGTQFRIWATQVLRDCHSRESGNPESVIFSHRGHREHREHREKCVISCHKKK